MLPRESKPSRFRWNNEHCSVGVSILKSGMELMNDWRELQNVDMTPNDCERSYSLSELEVFEISRICRISFVGLNASNAPVILEINV